MSGAPFPRIQTVTGSVPISVLDGPVLPHEHLRTDTRWGIRIDSDPRRWLDEERHIAPEIRTLVREHGLTLVIEHSCLGMGRDPAALARISMEARVRIVAATGFAAEPFTGDLIRRRDVDELTNHLLREIGAGLDGTGTRPGLIVAACWDEVPTPAEERAAIAAARAAMRTGLAVATKNVELMELLLSNGAPARRLSVHVADAPAQRKVAEAGAYVSVREAEHVLALLEAGHAERILLSSGVERQEHVAAYGGHGYGRLFDALLPTLSDAGVDGDTLHLITCENPLRWLAG